MRRNNQRNDPVDLGAFVCLVFADLDIAVYIFVHLAVAQLPPDKRIAIVFDLMVQN